MFVLFILSCKEDESLEKDYYHSSKLFSVVEYDRSSVEGVMNFMDSSYFVENMSMINTYSNYGQIVIDSNENGTMFSRCRKPGNFICNIVHEAPLYSDPCDDLISIYGYDSSALDKDFVVICTDVEPLFVQGKILHVDTLQNGEIDKYFLETDVGYVKYEDNSIIYKYQ